MSRPGPDQTSRVTTLPVSRPAVGWWAWPALGSWLLRVATAAALGIDAVVHWQDAPAYDAVRAAVSQGQLFRVEAVLAVAAGLLVLVRPRPSSWLAAMVVAGSALAAVLLYRYVDVGPLGPLPDMYENSWLVPGKLLSAYAEGAAVLLAGVGLLTHRRHPGLQRLIPMAPIRRKRG
jgi:hypothetical protein